VQGGCKRNAIISRKDRCWILATLQSKGFSRRTTTFAAVGVAFAASALTPECRAREQPASTAPIVLTLGQLDNITARGTSVRVEAIAEAQGPTATTSTQGAVRSVQTTVLRIDYDPHRPPSAQAKLLGVVPAQFYFAQGLALANGANSVRASVSIVLSGSFAYVQQVSETALTTTSITQAAAAFAIAITPGN
jgi:hypothetical protein